jgi:hypothetical protein
VRGRAIRSLRSGEVTVTIAVSDLDRENSRRSAWVVFGALDDIGLTDDERRTLEDSPQVTLVTIPDVGTSPSTLLRTGWPK